MKKKILIIDDYLPILECLRMMLELHHYKVEITQDGQCLLDKTATTPDLLLIDYHIPGVDGYSIFEQLKNNSELKHTPVILMSGHKDIEHLSQLFGARDFIAKPFNFDELLHKIAKIMIQGVYFELSGTSDWGNDPA